MKARLYVSAVTTVILATAAAAASASDYCNRAPREQWKPQAEARAAVEKLGYTVDRVKVDDGCYEVKATDKSGKRIEIKLDPTDLRVVNRQPDKSESPSAAR